MINKIIKIRGIGIFHDAIPSAIKLSKITTIYGENGRGKSTLSCIFFSLANNNPTVITARKTIGGTNNQEGKILIDNTPFNFENNIWNQSSDKIIIFDSEFVARNIYSGFTISSEQRESLLEFTLGESGGKLKQNVDELTESISKITSEIRETGFKITIIGNPLTIEAYIALQQDPQIDTKISENEKLVESLKNIDEIIKKPSLSEISISFPDFDTLKKSLLVNISSISDEARQKVIDHIATNLRLRDEQWIKKGLDLLKSENCPFCGKNLEGSEHLLDLYQQYFDESYQQYQIKLQAFQRIFQEKISDIILSNFQHSVELNNSIFDSNWKTVLTTNLDSSAISEIKPNLLQIREISQRLLTIKIADPLSTIIIDPEFDTLLERIKVIPTQIVTYNQYIRAINEEIRSHKQKLQKSDLKIAQRDLTNWRMRKARYEPPNCELCQIYTGLIHKKNDLVMEKETARKNLAQYTNELLDSVEESINEYLSQFNAGFSIVNIDTSNERGVPRLKYELKLRNQNFDLGTASNTPTSPSFSNTLSEGDKRTLAFAFFLAKTNLDPDLSNKIIIVDDPMSSLDQSRQFTTQVVLKSLASKGKQLIVLSHDPRFLQSFLENSSFPQEDCVTFEIKRSINDYSIITNCDLESCIQTAYKKNYRIVSNYVCEGQCLEKYQVVRSIRPLVEATLRNRYLDSLKGADGLGKMIDMIERSLPTSPLHKAKSHLSKLKELNSYTSGHIHDTLATDSVQQIADTELNKYARFALDLAQGS